MVITLHLTDTDNAPNRYAIQQGATFNRLQVFLLGGDYTLWTPRGQIRDNYASRGGTVQAQFSFFPLQLGSLTIDGEEKIGTILRPFLSAYQTSLLNWSEVVPRQSVTERAVVGKNVWAYDIQVASPEGVVERVVEGFVEISMGVTIIV